MLTKLNRTTLTDQAVQSLLTYIAADGLKPGEALPSEAKLAEDLGVSRPVIREALKALQGKGIITIVNGKGAIVRPIDAETLQTFFQRAVQADRHAILELMEVRRGIEVESALLAAERRTPEELADLTDIVMQMRRNLHQLDAYIELDATLHLKIAQATHNAMLYHLVESLHGSAQNAIREGLQQRRTLEDLARVQDLHEALLQQLAAGNAAAAGQAMAVHFDEAVTALVRPAAD